MNTLMVVSAALLGAVFTVLLGTGVFFVARWAHRLNLNIRVIKIFLNDLEDVLVEIQTLMERVSEMAIEREEVAALLDGVINLLDKVAEMQAAATADDATIAGLQGEVAAQAAALQESAWLREDAELDEKVGTVNARIQEILATAQVTEPPVDEPPPVEPPVEG